MPEQRIDKQVCDERSMFRLALLRDCSRQQWAPPTGLFG